MKYLKHSIFFASFFLSIYITSAQQNNNLVKAECNIFLSSDTILDESPKGSLLGVFSNNKKEAEKVKYYLTMGDGKNDTDNDSFLIEEDSLYTNTEFDYTEKRHYFIHVKCIWSNTEYCTQSFHIKVKSDEYIETDEFNIKLKHWE